MTTMSRCQRRGYHQAAYMCSECRDCGITRSEAIEVGEDFRDDPMTLDELSQ
jgi:hypothetical protein